eukprot:SAG11_NODE_1685_length_4449_cov_4.411954_2_plen_118_part_00
MGRGRRRRRQGGGVSATDVVGSNGCQAVQENDSDGWMVVGMKGKALALAPIESAAEPELTLSLAAELRMLAQGGANVAAQEGATAWNSGTLRPRLSVAPMMAWTTHHQRTLVRLLTV